MLKTRFPVAAFVLVAAFFVSASVQADSISSVMFKFEKQEGALVDISDYLGLTAVENEDKTGIDFSFVSTWKDAEVNGGGGVIWNASYYGPNEQTQMNSVYLLNHGAPLGRGLDGTQTYVKADNGSNPLAVWVPTGLTEIELGTWGMDFSVGYNSGYDWGDFIDIVNGDVNGDGVSDSDPFGFRITISGDNVLRPPYTGTFVTTKGEVIENAPPVAPEPATLLILGGGLAGLGIAACRRKK